MITPSFGLTATERVIPKLALDFTTASLDSRVTFTRTTGASNPATYVNNSGYITAATDNQPRFDYDPTTLVCKGLLIEESRVNLRTYSEQFDNAAWTKAGCTISQNSTASPDGSVNADKLVEDTSTGAHRVLGTAIATTSGVSYSFSFYAKSAGRDYCYIRMNNSGGDFITGTVQISTATVTQLISGTITVEALGGGWVRVKGVGTSPATANAQPEIRAANAATYANYTGDGSSGIYIWGAQVEAGAFATSYIPTTTAAVTRNADVATITGTNFSDFWQAGKGGVLVRARPGTVSGTRPWVQFDDGTADNLIAIRGNTTNPELYIVDSTTPQAQIDAGTIAANTDYAMTAWWNTDDCKARLDNGSVFSDTSATIPTVDQMRIGSDGTNYLNGHIASIGYYDRFSSQIYTRRKNKAVFSLL